MQNQNKSTAMSFSSKPLELYYNEIKNLAQVCADGELGGTTLEGSNLAITIPFFTRFFSSLTNEEEVSSTQPLMHN
jgi:hypothetical protein